MDNSLVVIYFMFIVIPQGLEDFLYGVCFVAYFIVVVEKCGTLLLRILGRLQFLLFRLCVIKVLS